MTSDDKAAVVFILQNFPSHGAEVGNTAEFSGFSAAKLIAVAKKYQGVRFRGGVITYLPPSGASFVSQCPGIANPRTGISSRVPASIAVRRR
jgi:hypothetical protein